jgi:hypothetical protein
MDHDDISAIIKRYIEQLRRMNVIGIEQYEKKLENNTKKFEKVDDLLFEGRATLAFLSNGFKVTLRESPDLKIELGSEIAYVEVKHFGRKEQDKIDDRAMSGTSGLLVPVGDTTLSEGSTPWEQIVNVAISKANQYMADAPNILIIESSSESLLLKLSTAAHEYDDRVLKIDDCRLRRLSALMLVNTSLIGFKSGPWNIEFCPLVHTNNPLSDKLISALYSIRLG